MATSDPFDPFSQAPSASSWLPEQEAEEAATPRGRHISTAKGVGSGDSSPPGPSGTPTDWRRARRYERDVVLRLATDRRSEGKAPDVLLTVALPAIGKRIGDLDDFELEAIPASPPVKAR